TPPVPRATPTEPVAPTRLDVIRSEWTKLRSVRSTWWTLFAVVVGAIGVSILVCEADVARWDSMSPGSHAGFDATFVSLTGLFIGQIAVGVLGVLVITSEYASGMIRTTFAAVQRRRRVLAAKAATLVGPAFAVSLLSSLVAFLVGQAILAGKGAGVSI